MHMIRRLWGNSAPAPGPAKEYRVAIVVDYCGIKTPMQYISMPLLPSQPDFFSAVARACERELGAWSPDYPLHVTNFRDPTGAFWERGSVGVVKDTDKVVHMATLTTIACTPFQVWAERSPADALAIARKELDWAQQALRLERPVAAGGVRRRTAAASRSRRRPRGRA